MKRSLFWIWLICGALMALAPQKVHACAVCFGAPDSPMTQGMNMGILSLLIIVGFVLAGFAAFIIYIGVRAASASRNAEQIDSAVVEREGIHP